MSVLRESRDSLVAMLEAFVHDPLISWRLLGTQGRQEESNSATLSTAGTAAATAAATAVPSTGGGGGGAGGGGAGGVGGVGGSGGGGGGGAGGGAGVTVSANMTRSGVPHRVSSPVPGDGGGDTQRFPPSTNAPPQAAQPPPTPRLGPVNPDQRSNDGGRLAPQEAVSNGGLPTGYGGTTIARAGPGPASAEGNDWERAATSAAVAAAAAAARTASVQGAVSAGQAEEGGRHGSGNPYPGRFRAGSGVRAAMPTSLRVGRTASSVSRPPTLAGMTPLQPVPEVGRGWRESDADSDVTADESGELGREQRNQIGLDSVSSVEGEGGREDATTSSSGGGVSGGDGSGGGGGGTNPDLGGNRKGGHASATAPSSAAGGREGGVGGGRGDGGGGRQRSGGGRGGDEANASETETALVSYAKPGVEATTGHAAVRDGEVGAGGLVPCGFVRTLHGDPRLDTTDTTGTTDGEKHAEAVTLEDAGGGNLSSRHGSGEADSAGDDSVRAMIAARSAEEEEEEKDEEEGREEEEENEDEEEGDEEEEEDNDEQEQGQDQGDEQQQQQEEEEGEGERRRSHLVPVTMSASIPISRSPSSAALDMSRPLSMRIEGDVQGGAAAGAGEEGVGSEEQDAEDEKLALATAAAAEAQAASMVRSTRQKNNRLINGSSNFHPHMHLEMQALSHRHNGTFSTRFVFVRACGVPGRA